MASVVSAAVSASAEEAQRPAHLFREAIMDSKKTLKLVSLFVAATAAGHVLSTSAPADAARALVSASACYIETGYDGDYSFNHGIENLSGGLGSRSRKVYCPVPDTAANPRSSVSQLWIAGFDMNNETPNANIDWDGRVLAQICLTEDWWYGVSCSNWVEVTPNTWTGHFDTNIANFGTANDPVPLLKSPGVANWYPNLIVSLPRTGVYGASRFKGFTMY
jgi:hypothetical protein